MKTKIAKSNQEKPSSRSKTSKPQVTEPDDKVTRQVWLDADVVAWLKSHEDGYQMRMNAILRREMRAVVRVAK